MGALAIGAASAEPPACGSGWIGAGLAGACALEACSVGGCEAWAEAEDALEVAAALALVVGGLGLSSWAGSDLRVWRAGVALAVAAAVAAAWAARADDFPLPFPLTLNAAIAARAWARALLISGFCWLAFLGLVLVFACVTRPALTSMRIGLTRCFFGTPLMRMLVSMKGCG